jgi:hypothetical protein
MNAEKPPPTPAVDALRRRKLVVIFSGLVVLGLLIGSGAGLLVNAHEDSAILVGALPAATPTESPTPTPTPTSTATPTPTGTPDDQDDPSDRDDPADVADPAESDTPDYRSISSNASSEPGLDFGYLTKVTEQDGSISLRFDRASFYTGAEAAEYNHGQIPASGYLIENSNTAIRSFPLDRKASIVAANRLLTVPGQLGQETLTVAEFLANSTRALAAGPARLPIWVRHTDGMAGPVTALAEQYLP